MTTKCGSWKKPGCPILMWDQDIPDADLYFWMLDKCKLKRRKDYGESK